MENQPSVCPKCGEQNGPGNNFCRSCGTPLKKGSHRPRGVHIAWLSICVGVALVAALVAYNVGFYAGDASAVVRINAKPASFSSTTVLPSSSAPSSSSKSDSPIYAFGHSGKIGSWNITVESAQITNIIKDDISGKNSVTDQEFIVLKLRMENISDSPAHYEPSDFSLAAYQTKTEYNADTDAMETANNNETILKNNSAFIGELDDANPNIPKETYLVFEVPKGTKVSDMALLADGGSSHMAGFYLQ